MSYFGFGCQNPRPPEPWLSSALVAHLYSIFRSDEGASQLRITADSITITKSATWRAEPVSGSHVEGDAHGRARPNSTGFQSKRTVSQRAAPVSRQQPAGRHDPEKQGGAQPHADTGGFRLPGRSNRRKSNGKSKDKGQAPRQRKEKTPKQRTRDHERSAVHHARMAKEMLPVHADAPVPATTVAATEVVGAGLPAPPATPPRPSTAMVCPASSGKRRPRSPTPPPGDSAMMLESPAMGEGDSGGGAKRSCKQLNFSEADTALADHLLRLWNAETFSRSEYATGPLGTFELIGGEYRFRWLNDLGTVACWISSGGWLEVEPHSFRADPFYFF